MSNSMHMKKQTARHNSIRGKKELSDHYNSFAPPVETCIDDALLSNAAYNFAHCNVCITCLKAGVTNQESNFEIKHKTRWLRPNYI